LRPDRFREVLSLQVDIAPALHQIAAGRDFQVQVLWNGPSVETDFSRQIQIVDSMIARNVDGSAVSASDRTALNGALERAARARIPVTVFDSGVESTNYMTFLATNNPGPGPDVASQLLSSPVGMTRG
jgi:ABC-type sugar transport system substrate-binding protein